MKAKRFPSLILSACLLLAMMPGMPALAAGSAPDAGSGAPGDPYIIDEPSELVWMSENYSSIRDKYFRQASDIDMTGVDFTPIGNGSANGFGSDFTGQYDGQAFEIQNLAVNSGLGYIGLFQYLSGTVKNVTLTDISFVSTATYNYSNAAGIAGYLANGVIQNCGVSGTISLTGAAIYSYTAGIAATAYGTIQDCFSTAALSNVNSGASMGGIAAYTGNTGVNILRCYFAGSVSGAATTKGGVVGNAYQGTIANNVFLSSSATYGRASSSSNEGCAPKSDSEMKARSTFESIGWDFTNIWKISEGAGYPAHMTAPSKPVNLAAAPDDGQITLSWDHAQKATGYLVYYGTAPGAYGTPVSSSGTSADITGLENGTLYYFAVRGLHAAEEGPLSDPVTCSPHDVVTDLAAVPENERVELTFSAPAGADTVELQKSDEGGPFSAVAGVSLTDASTSATVTGLVNGAEYSFRLRLVYGANEYFSNTVTVWAGNGDAALSALTVSGCTLSPAFAAGTYAYSAAVASGVSSVTVTAAVSSASSELYVASTLQESGTGKTVSLQYGANTVYIWVCAQNGESLGYTVTITRSLPASAVLVSAAASADDINFPPFHYVGEYSDIHENAALKFDLSMYSASPSYVELKIYISAADSMGTSGAFTLYGSDDDAWTDALPSSHDASPIRGGVTRPAPSADCWITVNVTDYVKNHLASKDKTVTFYLEGIRNETDIAFYPADSSQTAYRPQLLVVFQSTDARLSGISVGGAELAGFSPDTYSYSYAAPHGADLSDLDFTSAVNDAGASQGAWSYDAANKKWSVTVTAEDGTTTKTYTVTVDELPDIQVTGNITDTGTWAGSIPLDITVAAASGIAGVTVTKSGVTADLTASYTAGYAVAANGDYTFTVTSGSGLTASQTVHVTQIDDTPPNAPYIPGAENYNSSTWYRTLIGVQGFIYYPTAGADEWIQYKLDGGDWTDGEMCSVLSDGIHNVKMRVIDELDRSSPVTDMTVQIDRYAPTGTTVSFSISPFKTVFNFLSFGLFFNDTVNVNISGAADDGSGFDHYEYQKVAEGDTFDENGTWIQDDSLSITPEFKGRIYARAVDVAGNASPHEIKALVIDQTVPVISVASTALTTTDPNAALPVTVTDNGAGVGRVTYQGTGTGTHVVDLATQYNDLKTEYTFSVPLPEGIYDVVITAQDNSGNDADSVTVHVRKDITAPAVTGITPANGAINAAAGTDIVLTFSEALDTGAVGAVTLGGMTYTNGGNASVTISGNTVTVDPSGDFAHGATLTGLAVSGFKDTAGNPMAAYNAPSYSFTTEPLPTVSVSGNITAPEWSMAFMLHISVHAATGIQSVTANGADITASYMGGYSVSANGDYTFTVTSNSGLTASQTVHVTQIDNTWPNAPAITDAGNYTSAHWYHDDQTVFATFVSTPGSPERLQYSINGANWTDGNSATVSSEGISTVWFRVIDTLGSGRSSASQSATVQIDRTAPANMAINFDTSPFKSVLHFLTFGLFFDETVNAHLSAADGGSGVDYCEYQIVADGDTFDENGAWEQGDSLSITPDFKGRIYARAADTVGNVSGTVVKALVTEEELPVVSVPYTTVTTSDPDLTLPVTVADSGAGVGAVSYQLNGGAVRTVDLTAASYSDPTASYQFDIRLPWAQEAYDVVINAADNCGNAADTVTVRVENLFPTVTFVTVTPDDAAMRAGQTQAFAAMVNGTNDPPQAVTWSVSGNSSEGTAISDTGVLTVAADETSHALTVTATSLFSKSKSGAAAVAVIPDIVANGDRSVVFDISSAGLPGGVTGVSVKHEILPDSNRSFAAAQQRIGESAGPGRLTDLAVFDLTLLDQNGSPVTGVTGKIKVKLKIPDGMSGNLRVYWFDPETDALTDMDAAVEGGFLVFETNRFDFYAVAQLAAPGSGGSSGKLPDTGDNGPTAVWWLLAAVPALGCAAYGLRKKRKSNRG